MPRRARGSALTRSIVAASIVAASIVAVACLPPAGSGPERDAPGEAPRAEIAAAAGELPPVDPPPLEAAGRDAPATAAIPDEDARKAPEGPRNDLSPEDHARRGEAIAELDAGRYDHALALLRPLLARYPSNPAVRGLHDAAVHALAAMADASSASLSLRPAVRLARPPFVHTVRRAVAIQEQGPMPTLRKVDERRNGITDEEAWLARNGLSSPLLDVPNPFLKRPGALPQGIPPTYGDQILVRGIAHADHTILIYGEDFGDGRTLAVLGPGREVLAFYDFTAWLEPDVFVAGDRQFVDEPVVWAEARDGVLYVANGHRTYAASSKGHNAYLSALDLATGELLWRSPPLVHNAFAFVIHGPAIFAGYGFTAEPDFLHVVDRRDGAIVSKTPLRSGPDALIERDGQLHVRTYDHDYVFAID